MLTACSSDDDVTGTGNASQIIRTSAPVDYAFALTNNNVSAQIERIDLTHDNIVDNTLPSPGIDYSLTTDGEALYRIGRDGIDTLTRIDPTDLSAFDYELSIPESAAAPTVSLNTLTFVDKNLAYLTQRARDSLLIIDPTPDTQPATRDSLIRGRISLADYNRVNDDSSLNQPDMSDALVIDDTLYVLLDNLDGPLNDRADQTAYIALIDTRNNMEIDTNKDPIFKGLPLNTRNPAHLQRDASSGMIYVIGRGNFTGNPAVNGEWYSGGIESINPITRAVSLLVDDGTADDNQGFFINGLVINSALAYIITLDSNPSDPSRTVTSLRRADLNTGDVSAPMTGTDGMELQTLHRGPDNHLWIGFAGSTPGFLRFNLETGEFAAETVATKLSPYDLVFIRTENTQ